MYNFLVEEEVSWRFFSSRDSKIIKL